MSRAPLCLVTSNPQKAKEIQVALRQFGIDLAVSPMDIPEIKDLDLRQVVCAKADQAFTRLQRPVLVDDTGIFFVGYQNFPGAYSKFAFRALGWPGLFRLFRHHQRAYFCSYLALKERANQPPKLFRGVCTGRLVSERRGRPKRKMPYDSIFIPDGDTLTFSQMTIAGKQRYDHRSKAVRKLARYYLKKHA